MAKSLKRVLSEDEDESQQPIRKASKNIPDADEAPRSGEMPHALLDTPHPTNTQQRSHDLVGRINHCKIFRVCI